MRGRRVVGRVELVPLPDAAGALCFALRSTPATISTESARTGVGAVAAAARDLGIIEVMRIPVLQKQSVSGGVNE